VIFSRNGTKDANKKKRTLTGEMSRNLRATTYFGKWLISLATLSAKDAKSRREKSYSVAEDVSREEFLRRSVIFRRQVFIYAVMAIVSFCIAPFFTQWYVLMLCGMYFLSWYVIYIRDVHRVRMLIKNWELRNTALPLTWSAFGSIIKSTPKYLNPLC